VLKRLGGGGSGTVFLVEEWASENKNEYALKEIKRNDHGKVELGISRRMMDESIVEIVKIYEVFEEEGKNYVLMEYCEKGSLKDVIHNHSESGKKVFPESVLFLVISFIFIHFYYFLY
jgi:serine/threonine protein kinase